MEFSHNLITEALQYSSGLAALANFAEVLKKYPSTQAVSCPAPLQYCLQPSSPPATFRSLIRVEIGSLTVQVSGINFSIAYLKTLFQFEVTHILKVGPMSRILKPS